MFELCHVLERQGLVDGIVPRLARFLMKQHGISGWKHLLKTLGNAITETLIFKSSLDALAPKNLCLWCEFHSLSACYLIKTFWQPSVNAKNTWSVWFACALVAYLWAVRHSSQQISIPVTQLPKKGRREQHNVPKHHYISYSSCCILHPTGSNLTGIIY